MGRRTETDTLEGERLSIEEFEQLPDEEGRRELVRGRLVKEPLAGFEHSRIGIRIASALLRFAEEHGLGTVVGADAGFVLFDEPPTVRAPGVAFVAGERLTFDPDRFAPLAPHLAVEIVSPSNTVAEIHDKVTDYLDAGTRLVWVVDPLSRTVTAYRSPREIRLLTGDAEIDGGDVLPGLLLSLPALFGR